MHKNIVISAQNIVSGGPLTILNQVVQSLNFLRNKKVLLILFLQKKELISHVISKSKNIKVIEIKNYKKTFFHRIYYDLIYFKNFSQKKKIDVWISLQDIIPNVKSIKKIIYCHTPVTFLKMRLIDIYFEPYTFLRCLFYNLILRFSVYKNSIIIVQQKFIKLIFRNKFKLKNIYVFRPNFSQKLLTYKNYNNKINKQYTFFYPSLPRFQKNFEIICKAAEILKNKNLNFKIYFTFYGNENRYAKYILNMSKNIKKIKFIGIKSYSEVQKIYTHVDALVFSSRYETWGLPLTEAISYNLPIIVPNLNYSYETIGDYKKVSFFKHDDCLDLAYKMEQFIIKKYKFKNFNKLKPNSNSWNNLWKKFL